MAIRTTCSVFLLGLVLSVAGCLSSGGEEKPRHYYRVSIPREERALDPVPVSLVLRPFDVDGLLDREGILYQTSDVDRGYWLLHEWIEPVAGMVRSAIQEDLEASGLFEAVHLLENEPLSDIVVSAEIHEFGELDRPDGWYGVVDMTIEANRVKGDGRLVWRSRIRRLEKAEKRTVADTVRALGRALAVVSGEIEAGIIEGLR